MKKLLSLLLALTLVASLVVPAMAEGEEKPALPTATVTEISKAQLEESDAPDLNFALQFLADEPTEEQAEAYDNWYADFFLKLNKSAKFAADEEGADGYLAGQYTAWSENWISVPFGAGLVEVPADTEIPVMDIAAKLMGQSGLHVTYHDVYDFVKEFNCGIFFTPEYLEANPDLEVTLALRMVNPDDFDAAYEANEALPAEEWQIILDYSQMECYTIGPVYEYKAMDLFEASVTHEGETKYYLDFQDAFAAVADGDTITLMKDIELSKSLVMTKDIAFTLDGNGHTIRPAAGSTEKDSAFNWGQGSDSTRATRKYNIKNVVFDGWTTGHVVRLQGVTAEVTNCKFINCNQTSGLGLLTLTFTDAAVSGCTFKDNICLEVIDNNSWGDNSTSYSTIANCVFENNICNSPALLLNSAGVGLKVTGSQFINNTVNSTANGSILYMGWSNNCEVSDCLFSGNTFNTPDTASKRVGSAIFCDGCIVNNNAFVNNKAIRNGEEYPVIVAVGAYYNPANLSGNYWDGKLPVAGENYLIEFTKQEVTLEDCYLGYSEEAGLFNKVDAATGHAMTKTEAKAATCTVNGNIEYYTCSVCNKFYADVKGEKELAAADLVIAAAHKLDNGTVTKAATCTEKGVKTYKCTVNGCDYTKTEDIAIAGHKMTKTAAKAATYTAEGNIEYYTCSVCGKLFADAEGKKVITVADTVIAKLPIVVIEKEEVETDKPETDKPETDAPETEDKEEVTVPEVKVEVKVEVQEEAAAEIIEKAVEDAKAEEKAPVVVIDVKKEVVEAVQKEDTTVKEEEIKVAEVSIPTATVEKVAKADEKATLAVNLTTATVIMDNKALETVAKEAEGKSVELKIEHVEVETLKEEQQAAVENKNVALTVTATLICAETKKEIGKEEAGGFGGGKVTVAVPIPAKLPEGVKAADLQVWYVADDGTVTKIDSKLVDGSIVFDLEHFSEYVIAAEKPAAEKPAAPATGDSMSIALYGALAIMSVLGMAVVLKKKAF